MKQLKGAIMTTIGRKLIAAALAGGLAIAFSPSHVTAQTPNPEERQPGTQAQPQGKEGKQPSAQPNQPGQSRVPMLIGVISVTPIGITDPALPKGARYESELDKADQARATLAGITGAVFRSDGELNDVIDQFVDADRDRLDKLPMREKDFEQRQLSELKARVTQLRQAWEEKYGEAFEIKENQVYAPLMFAEGEITNTRQFMQKWPVGATGSMQGKQQKSAKVTEQTRDQANLEAGREFAVARFPAQAGLPATHVSFIDEAMGLKIDVPDGMTTAQLRTGLLQQLTSLSQSADKWPANVNDAYRLATHHVVMALYGVSGPRT
jgi:hypothetical protein